MGLFDNLKSVVTDAASNAQSATKEFVEVAKLENKVKHEKAEISALYEKIGETVYESYLKNPTSDQDLAGYCENIKQHFVIIEELKSKIEQVKNEKE